MFAQGAPFKLLKNASLDLMSNAVLMTILASGTQQHGSSFFWSASCSGLLWIRLHFPGFLAKYQTPTGSSDFTEIPALANHKGTSVLDYSFCPV